MYALLSSFLVVGVSLLVEVLVYRDWLHRTGPLRLVGSTIAAVIAFIAVQHWLNEAKRKQADALRRFQIIAQMNDSIRKSLQKIERISYASNAQATEAIRDAVAAIDAVLVGLVSQSKVATGVPPKEVQQERIARFSKSA